MATVISGPILVLDAATSVVAETTGSSVELANVDFALTNVQQRTNPLRTFRTNVGAASSKVRMDVPSGTTLAGCFIDNVNFDGDVTFHTYSAGATNQLTVTPTSDGDTIVKDPFTGRRRAYVRFETPVNFDGGLVDKIQVIAAAGSTIAPGAAYTDGFEWGAITYFEDGNEMGLPGGKINNMVYTLNDPQLATKFPGGASEIVEIGEKFVTITIPVRDYLEDSQQSFFDILLNRSTPIIFFENNGNIGRAYTTRAELSKSTKITYKVTGAVFSVTISLIETT